MQGARRDLPRDRPVRENVEEVLAQVDDNPHTSTRKVAANIGCSQSTVMRVLKEQLLHPLELVQVQALGPNDLPIRLQYCQWMRGKVAEVPHFLGLVASTGEKGQGGDFQRPQQPLLGRREPPRHAHPWLPA